MKKRKIFDKSRIIFLFISISIIIIFSYVVYLLFFFEKINEEKMNGSLNSIYPTFYEQSQSKATTINPIVSNSECDSDSICFGQYKDKSPVCNLDIGKCVECFDDGDCIGKTFSNDKIAPACSIYNICVSCTEDSHCIDNNRPYCKNLDCVECKNNGDCMDNLNKVFCGDDSTCVECLISSDCGDKSKQFCVYNQCR